ncbi:MAG: GNAT family N-acetyltransferase [Litoreibacter sp.]
MRTASEFAELHAKCFVTPRAYKAHEFQSLLAGTGIVVFEQPHGFLVCRIIADEAELLTVAVDPDARRKGVASHLLGSLLAHCEAARVTTIFLDVAVSNHAAQALYEIHGFIETTRRNAYYRRPDGGREDAVLMMRDIH